MENPYHLGSEKARGRRDEFVVRLQALGSVGAAVREMGIARHTYDRWRNDYEDFRFRVEQIKASWRGEVPGRKAWDGGFAQGRKRFFGMDTYAHQIKLVEAVDQIGPREVGLILLWPEAGKTTTLEDYICLRLGKDPNLRVVELSESSGLSRKIVGRVKSRMTDGKNFSDFITTFGPFYMDGQERDGKPWAADYFTVWGAKHDERDYSLEARAITSAAYGSRIDLLVCDDIQSRRTYSQTETILEHLQQTYFTRGRQMSIVFVGTRIGPGDVYEQLMERELVDWVIELPAVRENGEPFSPEMWVADPSLYGQDTPERDRLIKDALVNLNKIRHQVGEEVWYASYQQEPQAKGVATFTPERVAQAQDKTRVIGPGTPGGYCVASLDPALGGGNALGVGEYSLVEKGGQRVPRLELLDMDFQMGLARVEQILELVADFALRYRFAKLVVEANAFQKSLAADDRLRQMSYDYGFTVVPHTTGLNKADPVLGVAAMAGSFTRQEISIPAGDDLARHRMEPLIVQLRAWRATIPTKLLRQDAVMMLWFMWRDWMEHRRSQDAGARAWSLRRRLPWRPSTARMITTTDRV